MPSGVYERTDYHRRKNREADNSGRFQKGHKAFIASENKGWFKKGHKISIAIRKKMSKAQKGNNRGFQKGLTPWNKDKKIPFKSRLYQKGKPTWNKGKILPPLSLEHRLKMSKSHKKIAHKCHFWKGGITPINAKIRNSMKFRLWREAVYERDNYTCQICEERGGKLNPHHIWNFALFPHLRLNIDNGITLCIDCHKEVHKGDKK